MAYVVLIFACVAVCILSFYAGNQFQKIKLLRGMEKILEEGNEAAIQADAHMLKPNQIHIKSYDIGYFQGRDECFNEVLDLIDKKLNKKEVKRHDRGGKK